MAWWGARRKSVGRNRIARSGQDSIGRVAADREAGADYAGNSKGCGRSNKLRIICPDTNVKLTDWLTISTCLSLSLMSVVARAGFLPPESLPLHRKNSGRLSKLMPNLAGKLVQTSRKI